MIFSTFKLLCVAALLLSVTGCVGIYDNTQQFLNTPDVGETEAQVITRLGTPAFSSGSGDDKLLTYNVRDNKYIILIGMYDGYDLVIVFQDGKVVETSKVQIANAFALFSPWNWVVAE